MWKDFSVLKFANENYKNVVYVNFVENPDLKLAFYGSKTVDNIVMYLSAQIQGSVFPAQETCLVLDELQECPEARTALKFFKIDGRFDVICTGSLLGVKGYETIVDMYPLDFEEFLWANGINDNIIDLLKDSLEKEKPVPEAIHKRLGDLLRQYVVVGGMPEAVNTFIATHNIGQVVQIQKDIIDEYKDDMVKYADDSDKSRIRECFESIPKQLSKENKKFQYSVVRKKGRASEYLGSLQWIEDAGIIRRCYNLSITELPLDGNAIKDVFKVYMCDTGLFVSMLELARKPTFYKAICLAIKVLFLKISWLIFSQNWVVVCIISIKTLVLR